MKIVKCFELHCKTNATQKYSDRHCCYATLNCCPLRESRREEDEDEQEEDWLTVSMLVLQMAAGCTWPEQDLHQPDRRCAGVCRNHRLPGSLHLSLQTRKFILLPSPGSGEVCTQPLSGEDDKALLQQQVLFCLCSATQSLSAELMGVCGHLTDRLVCKPSAEGATPAWDRVMDLHSASRQTLVCS